ncbi:MAG TPA: methionyl-tRNA formyltransferase [Candidatus Saccharimonadales bacterium]|nr:methionyl-tRNA formyltransferase [Candidatus Saccharimonadales bacterium]
MRLVFCGTAPFAVPSLRACAAHHDVAAVVTRPDRLGSRGRQAPRPVGDTARALGLQVLAPARIGAPEVVRDLLAMEPDCLVVAAYGQILPVALIEPPPHGAVNVHASLLPRWRGASPIAHAILAGDAETGVSIMRMEAGLDTGPVYATVRVPIDTDATTPTLTATLAGLGASKLIAVLATLEGGTAVASAQPEDGMTYAPRLGRVDGRVDWAVHSSVDVDRMVRALQPWPGVLAQLDGVEVQIQAGSPVDIAGGTAPGTLVAGEGESVVIAARAGGYRVDLITPPGRRAMAPAAFLRGRRSGEAKR